MNCANYLKGIPYLAEKRS